MSILQILFLAVALSMDAMAVSIGTCTRRKAPSASSMLVMAISFGVFQAVMPLVGYSLGSLGAAVVQSFDHWIAFGLLVIVGGKMVYEGFTHQEENCDSEDFLAGGYIHWHTLLVLSIATSLDAAAVGISLSMVQAPILWPSLVIGIVTFSLAWAGGHFGRFLGIRMGKIAEVLGGLVLVGIGVKILLEHG